MVVFTCNHCGDSIQKPKVEKHYQFTCRNSVSLTCVDCLKDFRGDEFVDHIKCISEDQRYGARGSINGGPKKGEAKQESWVEMIRSIIKKEKNIKQSHRDLLHKISNFNNVPRKKHKFMNFIKSSSGGRVNMREIEDVWDIIENYKTKTYNALSSNAEKKTEAVVTVEKSTSSNTGVKINSEIKLEENSDKSASTQETLSIKQEYIEDATEKTAKKSKRKVSETENNEFQPTEKKIKSEPTKKTKFDFSSKILEILQAANSTISPAKLKKKVEKLYVKETGETFTDKALRKYLKKLDNMENIECTEEYVKLR